MNKQLILDSIQKIKNSLIQIEEEVNKIQVGNAIHPSVEISKEEKPTEFEELKKLLESNQWPEAVLSFQIVDQNSEEEKLDRAEGVVDILIEEELEDKKFLDFGCGEGHMAKYVSSQKTKTSVGYDITKSDKSNLVWEEDKDNLLLTTNFERVKEKGPYDIILIYDVIDHSENPQEVLEKARSVLSDGGKIYLRCHPWCGRHGGHYYRQINKAFVHLVFTEEELVLLGYNLEEKNKKVLFPIISYNDIIMQSDLNKIKEDPENQELEDFFQNNPVVSERIRTLYRNNGFDRQFPKFQMELCFIDYVLGK